MDLVWCDEKRRSARQVRLWLVDDHVAFRIRFARLLENIFGFQGIRQFESAEAAIDALRPPGNRPDAILLDVKLPGMSGVDAIEWIKTASPCTRILMFTTFFDVQAAAKAAAAGAGVFLTKSMHYEEVALAICGRPQPATVPGQQAHDLGRPA